VQVRLAKPEPTTLINNNNNDERQVALPGTSHDSYIAAAHLQTTQPEYITADGSDDEQASGMLCRWQFNVAGYQPTEVNVKVEGGRLLVSARSADVKDVDNKSSSQLSKQMDIPRDVMIEEMTSYMTQDGVLVVQAPVAGSRDNAEPRPPRSEVKMAAVNGDSSKELECRFRPIELPPEQPPSGDVISASRRHVVKTGFDTVSRKNRSHLYLYYYL